MTTLEIQLQKKEQALEEQLLRVADLVEQKESTQIITEEYTQCIERIVEKYEVLFQMLSERSASMDQETLREEEEALREQCTQDITILALAIDKARGEDVTSE